jgi:hypothetical protein
MAGQTVTLHLSDELFQRFSDVAATTKQPLEAVLYQTIQNNLPPSLGDLPSALQAEVAPLLTMENQTLVALAHKPLPAKQWRHQQLLTKAQQESLLPEEQAELAQLRTLTDQFVLKRSYALAILKWRGYSLPFAKTAVA